MVIGRPLPPIDARSARAQAQRIDRSERVIACSRRDVFRPRRSAAMVFASLSTGTVGVESARLTPRAAAHRQLLGMVAGNLGDLG